jgi:DNA gyrase subunit A
MSQREEDFVEELFIASTHDYILFFTSRGRCFRLKAYEIGESGRMARGVNIVNLLPIEPEEKITAMIKVSQAEEDGYLVMATKAGIIKRTHLSAFRNVRKNGLIALNLREGDELCGVRLTTGINELMVATAGGLAIRFMETDVREMSRVATGVRAIRLRDGDEVVSLARLREGATVLTVSERGLGRRTEIANYRMQSRGGKGILNYNTKKNGLVAGVKVVDDTDDSILISDHGIIIRIPAGQINVHSRYGGGVRVMKLEEGHRVVTLARSAPEEDDTETTTPNGEPTAPQAPTAALDLETGEETTEEEAAALEREDD